MTADPRVVDQLAADIRLVDGAHQVGAGALAEALVALGWKSGPAIVTLATQDRLTLRALLNISDMRAAPTGLMIDGHGLSVRVGDSRFDSWTPPIGTVTR